MDVSSLHTQLKQGQLSHFYIFTGPEWKVQQIYIDQIVKTSGLRKYYMNNFLEVFGKLKSPGMLSKNCVYVIRDDKDILKEEKVREKINKSLLGKNILILLVTNVDKRTTFYKQYKNTIVEFEPLQPKILKKYLQKEIQLSDKLSDKNFDTLMEVCEYDYGRCLLEIDKIKQWIAGYGKDKQKSMSVNGALVRLLNAGIIYQPPKDAIFDFVDAVLDRKVNLSYNLYNQCIEVGEATLVMLSVLYNNAKAVLQVQSYNGNDLSKATGLTGWQIKNAKEHCNVYRNWELVELLKRIQKCESGIKTGKIDEQFVMDYVLTNTL